MIRPVSRAPLTEQQAALWDQFLDCYLASEKRDVVDRFLRAMIGAPRA